MPEILIVDDNPALREGLTLLLSDAGYAVRSAENGKKAIAAFEKHKPDLVLLDIMMPVMDGFETCEKLIQLDSNVPVIFLSAKDGDEDQKRGFELGADDFIVKTSSRAMILTRIKVSLIRAAKLRSISLGIPVSSSALQLPMASSSGSPSSQPLTVSSASFPECTKFTKTESDIYKVLSLNKGRYLTYKQIFDAIRGEGYFANEGAIRSHISRMRNKLPNGERIEVRRGIGFILQNVK